MDTAVELQIPKVRCAPFHEALGVDPVGSAGAYDAFLCVEVPLPWERDVSTNEPFRSLLDVVGAGARGPDGRTWRPQALVGPADGRATVRVLAFEQPLSPDGEASSEGGTFQRRQWSLASEDVLELGRALIQCDRLAVAAFEDRIDPVDPSVIDLFVCTHGKRDTCCGRYGTDLFNELVDELAGVAGDGPGCVRLWRVSHTGGHRFAPTALTFPDGYAWAHLDVGSARELVRRTASPAAVASKCRGSSSLHGGPAQAADRAALVRIGWSWLETRRHVSVVAFDRATLATTVRIDGEWPDGTRCSFEALVEIERHVPQTTCGSIDGPEYAVEPVWNIASFRTLSD